jgi:SAM-dependent methyltransferase
MIPGEPVRPMSPEELRAAFDQAVDGSPAMASGTGGLLPEVQSGLEPADPPGARLDIGSLMALPDRAFVERAYRSLLDRAPDDSGLRYYMEALAAGMSRITVLGGLRYSPEGIAVGRPVPGLRQRYLIHRLYGIRGFGRLLRSLTGVLALPGLMRDQFRLEHEVHALQSQLSDLQQLSHRLDGAERRLDASQEALDASREAARSAQQDLQVMREEVGGLSCRLLEEPWTGPILELGNRSDRQAERLARVEDFVRLNPELAADIRDLGQLLSELRVTFDLPANGTAAGLKRLAQDQRNLSARAITAAEEVQSRLRDQEQRVSLILRDLRRLAADRGAAEIAASADEAQAGLLDSLYVAFEDRFRGSRADIKRRQRVYLATLREAGAGTAERPIVDVGSGRGELLELLGEEGLVARGVDLNAAMVELCRGIGLDSVQADAVDYLNGVEPGGLGAVTGFHIIEHLPFPVMVALLDASLRALAPGGLVIFETPNPANLLVASRWFYLDPTHRNPLPGEMVAMIAEARGFVQVGIRELHPMQARFAARDEVLAAELDRIFHGPQDYALIARKAA